jgi:hypothetical protein
VKGRVVGLPDVPNPELTQHGDGLRHEERAAQPVSVVDQVRQLVVPHSVQAWIVAAGVEQRLTFGSDLAADLLLGFGSSLAQVAVELYFQQGTVWGQGFPLPASGIIFSGYIGPLYVRCGPNAANSADIRFLQTRAVAKTQQLRPRIEGL